MAKEIDFCLLKSEERLKQKELSQTTRLWLIIAKKLE
jgi:hypothetical protein